VRALGLRVEVRGRPPRGPFLLVTNHSSYADIPILASQANGWFVAKAEIARWPMAGLLARGVGTLFLERGAHRSLVEVGRGIEGRMERGYGVFLFPEGGIPEAPGVGAFRGSLLEPAARRGLEVRCAAIRYATGPGEPPADEAVEWRSGEPIYAHLMRLLGLRGARACVVFDAEPMRAGDRKELASALEARVRELYAAAAPGR
jgi:1-acyl-sn-glycerol-3-phosphate acyltransferase